jgi:pimeloyl-ACP methyl ester carboxylesterase
MESLGNDVLGLGLTLSPKRSFAVVGHDVGAVATYGAMALQPSRVACAVTMAVPHPAAFLRNLPRRPDQWLRSCYMALFQGGRSVEALVEAGDFALVDALWARWAPGWHPPPSYRRAVHDCLQASMPHPLGFYRALVRPPARALGLFRRFVSQNQGDTTVPVLSMHGARDGCIHPALGRNQRSHFHGPFEEVLFPNLGHFLHLEEPSTIVRRTVAWVTKYLTVERVVVS